MSRKEDKPTNIWKSMQEVNIEVVLKPYKCTECDGDSCKFWLWCKGQNSESLREIYEKGRADAIDECKTLLKTSHMIRTTEDDFSAQIEIPFYRKLWKAFEELKEQSNGK